MEHVASQGLEVSLSTLRTTTGDTPKAWLGMVFMGQCPLVDYYSNGTGGSLLYAAQTKPSTCPLHSWMDKQIVPLSHSTDNKQDV